MLFYELSTPYIMALQYQTRSNFAAHFFQKSFAKYFTYSLFIFESAGMTYILKSLMNPTFTWDVPPKSISRLPNNIKIAQARAEV